MALTRRQTDVLQLLAKGHGCRRVGELLDMKENTVKKHAVQIRHTLRARNTAHAVAIGLFDRIIEP